MGNFNYFLYTIHIEWNWYMITAVRDLEVAFFQANSTWFYDICSKDLSNTPIYAVLNTQIYADINESGQNRLEWLEILEMLWSVIRLIFKTSSVTPDFFFVFNLILSFSTCSQSLKENQFVGTFGRERP